MQHVKQPHNYGPTSEEQEISKRKELNEKEKREREEREERERDEQEAANDRMKKQKDWTNKLEQIKQEEFQMLDAQATPLRNYLMAHVMPTLTKALIGNYNLCSSSFYSFSSLECCQVRPEDPVDFVVCIVLKSECMRLFCFLGGISLQKQSSSVNSFAFIFSFLFI